MDLANAKLVPTQEVTNIGTDVANARLMPTREATKVGTLIANVQNLCQHPQLKLVNIHVDTSV